jgi:hypothetical protein
MSDMVTSCCMFGWVTSGCMSHRQHTFFQLPYLTLTYLHLVDTTALLTRLGARGTTV